MKFKKIWDIEYHKWADEIKNYKIKVKMGQ